MIRKYFIGSLICLVVLSLIVVCGQDAVYAAGQNEITLSTIMPNPGKVRILRDPYARSIFWSDIEGAYSASADDDLDNMSLAEMYKETELTIKAYANVGDIIKVTFAGSAKGTLYGGIACINADPVSAKDTLYGWASNGLTGIGSHVHIPSYDVTASPKFDVNSVDEVPIYEEWRPFYIVGFWEVNSPGRYDFTQVFYNKDMPNPGYINDDPNQPLPIFILAAGRIAYIEVISAQDVDVLPWAERNTNYWE